MNRHEKPEAKVQYLDGEYRVLRPGLFVVCAVTGAPIALEDLRYWSVDLPGGLCDSRRPRCSA